MKHTFGIITPIWQRPKLTRLMLDHTAEHSGPSRLIGVQSPEDDPIKADYWRFITVPNSPLSDKHNAGAEYLRRWYVDAVLLLPSDDFLSPAYFEAMSKALDDGYDSAVLKSFYFYCLQTGRLLRGSHLGIGAGFMFSRALMDRVDWQPWPHGTDKSMDANMFAHCRKHIGNQLIIESTEDYGFVGVDCKGRTTRNGFQHLWDNLGHKERIEDPAAVRVFWETHFPNLADRMLHDREDLAQ